MEPERELILRASELGVLLSGPQALALLVHLRELARWNAKHNLVGPGDLGGWLERHTLDSLAAAPHLPPGEGLDVGSGAGFPGLPLAIARPDCRLTLVEPRRKRAAFLQSVVAALGIGNVEVQGERVAPDRAPVDFALSRATFPPEEWLALAAPLVRPGGTVVAFLGPSGPDEAACAALAVRFGLVPAGWSRYQIGAQPPRTLARFVRAVPRGTSPAD